MKFRPFAGTDPYYGPKIPNGSVWQGPYSTYLVQWNGSTAPDDRCWLLLGFCEEPYHTDGRGGTAFCPVARETGQVVYTQSELKALLEERQCTRVDAHCEPVPARRD